MVLEHGEEVTVGSDGIDGTTVALTNSTDSVSKIEITYAMDDDVVLEVGESFTDPVFGGFAVAFGGIYPALEDASKDHVSFQPSSDEVEVEVVADAVAALDAAADAVAETDETAVAEATVEVEAVADAAEEAVAETAVAEPDDETIVAAETVAMEAAAEADDEETIVAAPTAEVEAAEETPAAAAEADPTAEAGADAEADADAAADVAAPEGNEE